MSQILIAFDVNVTYAQPHSRTQTTLNFDGTSDVHTLHELRHLFGGLSLCLKNALRKQLFRGRKYVRELAYLGHLHIRRVNPRTRP